MSFVPDPSSRSPDRAACNRPSPRPLSAQDRATAAALVSAAQLVNRVIGDTDLASLLESQGYDTAELQAGVTLHAAAEEVFGTCQQALGELDRAQVEFDAAWENAREDYLEFRWLARREFADDYTQQVLQVLGTVSDDLHEFIAQAAISYRAAQLLDATQPLLAHGFGADRIHSSLAQLRRLARLELELHAGRSRAERHRDERDLAIAMLNLWMRDFERAARCAIEGCADSRPPQAAAALRRRKLRPAGVSREHRCPRFPSRFALRFPLSRNDRS